MHFPPHLSSRPFREGEEFWFPLEMVRKLILCCLIGAVATTCGQMLLMAQFVALVFMVWFGFVQPYRHKAHNMPVKMFFFC